MTRLISKKVKGFVITHLPGHIMALVFLWIISNFRIWIIFLIAYLGLITVAFLREVFRVWRLHRQLLYSEQAERLMNLIRDLIDLAFVHDENKEKFYDKFLEEIGMPSLRKRGIIDPDTLLRTPRFNRMCGELRCEDAELWILLMAGFSSRELKVIYGMTNINSVYIKRHRLRGRLDKKMQQLLDSSS